MSSLAAPRFGRDLALALGAAPIVWVLLAAGFANHRCCARPAVHALLTVVVLQPIVEEILFRGVLQGSLRRIARLRAGTLVTEANLITSAAFAAFHLLAHSPGWAVATIAPSLVFGYFRDRYETLVWPILIHAFYNAGYLSISSN